MRLLFLDGPIICPNCFVDVLEECLACVEPSRSQRIYWPIMDSFREIYEDSKSRVSRFL